MQDGYIDVLAKKKRIFCKKHRVLIAGQCPFCKEELKKKISKIKKEDCERHKLRYQAIRADPTLNAKLKRYWEDHWKKRKNDNTPMVS